MRNSLIVVATSTIASCLIASTAGFAAAAGLQDAKSTPVITDEQLTWQEVNADNFPKGMKVSVLVSSGDYSVTRVWIPPHAQIPPHTHAGNAEAVTVVGGKVGLGFGTTMETAKPLFGPGAFFVLAEGDYHFVYTGDEPGIFDVQVEKNSGITFAPMKMN